MGYQVFRFVLSVCVEKSGEVRCFPLYTLYINMHAKQYQIVGPWIAKYTNHCTPSCEDVLRIVVPGAKDMQSSPESL